MATFDTSVVFFNEHGKSTRSAILWCAILLQRWNKLQTAVKNEKKEKELEQLQILSKALKLREYTV